MDAREVVHQVLDVQGAPLADVILNSFALPVPSARHTLTGVLRTNLVRIQAAATPHLELPDHHDCVPEHAGSCLMSIMSCHP